MFWQNYVCSFGRNRLILKEIFLWAYVVYVWLKKFIKKLTIGTFIHNFSVQINTIIAISSKFKPCYLKTVCTNDSDCCGGRCGISMLGDFPVKACLCML